MSATTKVVKVLYESRIVISVSKFEEIVQLTKGIATTLNLKRNRNLKEFMDIVFEEVAKKFDLCRDFQARAKVYGDAFEAIFMTIMETFFPDIELIHQYEIPEICMTGEGKADFVILKRDNLKEKADKIVAVIEAKGSADYIICDGKRIKLPRPGMVRTDTVKKAISNAAQVKHGLSEDVLFFVVTSHKPTRGNAKCMIDLALKSGLFDMVVDVTNFDELKKMVLMIKKRLELG